MLCNNSYYFFFCFSYANENELAKSIFFGWVLGIIFGIVLLIGHPLLLPNIHTQKLAVTNISHATFSPKGLMLMIVPII